MHVVHMDSNHPHATTAVSDDVPPPYWGDHEARPFVRLEFGWIVTTWAMCLAVGVVIALVSTAIVAALSEAPLTGEQNTTLGVLTIISAMSTFIAFASVITFRLVRVEHDRLANSLGVGVFHVLVAIALFAIELALQGAGIGVGDVLEGTATDEVGNAFTVLERSSVAAILASLLSVGMVPARGGRPKGTQTDALPTEVQL